MPTVKKQPIEPKTPIAKLVEEQVKEKTEPEKKAAPSTFSPSLISSIADEVSKTLMTRLPGMVLPRSTRRKTVKKTQKIEFAYFLDTSAIIDGRIFDVIYLGVLNGVIVITAPILLELKHIADTQDTVKRVRGRKGLEALEKLRKSKQMKVVVLPEEPVKDEKKRGEVDELLIKSAKYHKGKVVTCDYNLEKKASIDGVTAINVNALANCLKVQAVPGESVHIKISHVGKDKTQGIGYLDDGTMIVVEEGSEFVSKEIDVVVSRVIQKATGRILFAKKI